MMTLASFWASGVRSSGSPVRMFAPPDSIASATTRASIVLEPPVRPRSFVSRDARGMLRHGHDGADFDVTDPPGSTLWQLLNGDDLDTSPPTPLELHSAGEVGLDLAAVEPRLPDRTWHLRIAHSR
jgi:hypothetical protein